MRPAGGRTLRFCPLLSIALSLEPKKARKNRPECPIVYIDVLCIDGQTKAMKKLSSSQLMMLAATANVSLPTARNWTLGRPVWERNDTALSAAADKLGLTIIK